MAMYRSLFFFLPAPVLVRCLQLTLQPCHFANESNETSSLTINYHWQRTANISTHMDFGLQHVADVGMQHAQVNHRCGAEQLSLLAQVEVVIDSTIECKCADYEAECISKQADTPFEKLKDIMILFVGDSRMSGEARVFADAMRRHCPTSDFHIDRVDDKHDTKISHDFAATCTSKNASVAYIRDNALTSSSVRLRSKLDLIRAQGSELYHDPTMVVFGTFVWDIIDRAGFPKHLHGDPKEVLEPFVGELSKTWPVASKLLRGSPPVNVGRGIEGPLQADVGAIVDLHDQWVAREYTFAASAGLLFLDASRLVDQYQGAVSVGVRPVSVADFFKDSWHPCVPFVPFTWVQMFPFLAV